MMGAIPFTQIPESLLVPGQYQEIDNSLAGGVEDVKRVLIVDVKGATGEAVAGQVVGVTSEARARTLLVAGSPAARLAQAYLKVNKVDQLFVLPVAENAAGVKAVKKITFTNVATKAGVLTRYIGGQKVQVAVGANEPSATSAAAFIAAVNGLVDMPVEASAGGAGNEVLLTAGTKGTDGNFIDIAAGLAGETDPAGVSLVVTTVTAGAGNPDAAAALAALGDVRYHYILTTLDDLANMTGYQAELTDRYSATRQIGARLFVAISGEVGDETAAGTMIHQAETINNPHLVLIPRGKNPHDPASWVGRLAGKAIRRLADDPAANTYGLEVDGLVVTHSYTAAERQALLMAGIATWKESAAGGVVIERLVTSYTENADGDRDTSYLDVQVTETVDAIRTYNNSLIAKRYKGWKLAATNENFGPGAKVMTSVILKSFLIETYAETFIKERQWCQDLDSYKSSVIVIPQPGSKTRLNYQHRPTLIGQFYQAAGLTQFE